MRFDLSRSSHFCKGAPVLEARPGVELGDWTIDFDTIEELMAFVNAHGSVVLSDAVMLYGTDEKSLPFIEIYDDYRE